MTGVLALTEIIDRDDLRQLAEMIVNSPFLSLVGLRLDDIAPGRCRMRLRIRVELLNPHNVAHGGAVFTLADATAAVTMRSVGANVITAQASINLLMASELEDELLAEGSVLHLGRRTGVAEVLITNQQGRPVARGSFTFLRLAGRHWDRLATEPSLLQYLKC